jgi:hypothetical protein
MCSLQYTTMEFVRSHSNNENLKLSNKEDKKWENAQNIGIDFSIQVKDVAI